MFLVDDQIPFLRAAAAVVGATDGFRVVGCATSGVYAAEQIIERGDELGLVLLDVQLGDLDGPSVRARIAQAWPDLAVAYLSTIDRSDLPDDAWDFPVVEFFPKASFGPEAAPGHPPEAGWFSRAIESPTMTGWVRRPAHVVAAPVSPMTESTREQFRAAVVSEQRMSWVAVAFPLVLWAFVDRESLLLVLSGVFFALGMVRRQAVSAIDRGDIEWAIVLFTATKWMVSLVFVIVLPIVLPIAMINIIMPIALVSTQLPERRFPLMVAAAMFVTLLAGMAGYLQNVFELELKVDPWVWQWLCIVVLVVHIVPLEPDRVAVQPPAEDRPRRGARCQRSPPRVRRRAQAVAEPAGECR